MRNQEIIYREILHGAIEKNKNIFTQSELSKKLDISLSIVNSAIRKLDSIGAVKIMQRSFKIFDIKKILYFWASLRNLDRDIIFRIRVEAPVREIERVMPNIVFTAYTSYKLRFNDVPADYSEIYAYAERDDLQLIKKRISRFKLSDKNPNLFILLMDKALKNYKSIPISQIYVDLWNLKEWYAKDFINVLENKIFKKS